MSILIIGPAEQEMIFNAVAAARANTVPWSVLRSIVDNSQSPTMLLDNRRGPVDEVRRKYKPQNVMLGTYRCAISFEEQPAGLMRHLSISTRKGSLPGHEVLEMVLPEFGFSGIPLQRPGRVWNEEFEPGWFAINVVELER